MLNSSNQTKGKNSLVHVEKKKQKLKILATVKANIVISLLV